MRRTVSSHLQVKAAGGVRTLDALIDVMNLGVTRVGATATKVMIDDFRARRAGAGPATAGPTKPVVAAGAAETGY
jgi:deoxyribose-phosphate aldolase